MEGVWCVGEYMRFLHLADLHIGKRVNGFSMLEDQMYILNEILKLVEEYQTDAVLIAGDVYDKALPSAQAVQVLDQFISKLVELGQQVFISCGNHDSAERLAFGGDVLKRAGVYVTPVFSKIPEPIVLRDKWGEIGFYMLPFLRPSMVRTVLERENVKTGHKEEEYQDGAELQERAEQQGRADNQENAEHQEIASYQDALSAVMSRMEPPKERRNVLLAHQFLTGALQDDSEEFMVGGVENVDYELFTGFDYVALGHIHRAQKVGKDYIRYSGTPLKYSFSEASHKKSATLVEIEEKGKISIQELPLKPLRELRKLKGSYDELVSRENYVGTNTEDYLHITLTDEEEILDVMNKLRFIYPNMMKLEYDNTRTRTRQLIIPREKAVQKNPMDLFETFYEQQNNQKMTDAQRDFAQSILKQIQGGDV